MILPKYLRKIYYKNLTWNLFQKNNFLVFSISFISMAGIQWIMGILPFVLFCSRNAPMVCRPNSNVTHVLCSHASIVSASLCTLLVVALGSNFCSCQTTSAHTHHLLSGFWSHLEATSAHVKLLQLTHVVHQVVFGRTWKRHLLT